MKAERIRFELNGKKYVVNCQVYDEAPLFNPHHIESREGYLVSEITYVCLDNEASGRLENCAVPTLEPEALVKVLKEKMLAVLTDKIHIDTKAIEVKTNGYYIQKSNKATPIYFPDYKSAHQAFKQICKKNNFRGVTDYFVNFYKVENGCATFLDTFLIEADPRY